MLFCKEHWKLTDKDLSVQVVHCRAGFGLARYTEVRFPGQSEDCDGCIEALAMEKKTFLFSIDDVAPIEMCELAYVSIRALVQQRRIIRGQFHNNSADEQSHCGSCGNANKKPSSGPCAHPKNQPQCGTADGRQHQR